MQRTPLAMALPLLAAIVVIIWGGGIGVIFIVLNETGAGVWGAIIIGMALVVGIPLLAAIHRPILDILLPPFEAVQRQMSEIADLLSPALKRPSLAMVLPILAALVIIGWGGGIGIIFIVLNETGAGVWGAIIIGMGLVLGIPSVAALLAVSRR